MPGNSLVQGHGSSGVEESVTDHRGRWCHEVGTELGSAGQWPGGTCPEGEIGPSPATGDEQQGGRWEEATGSGQGTRGNYFEPASWTSESRPEVST